MTTNYALNAVVWTVRTSDYYDKWSTDERRAVDEFLRAHDIDPGHVPLSRDNSIDVRVTETGAFEMDVWVNDLTDGKASRCPHCPGCLRQKPVTREVTTALPALSTAWMARGFSV